MHLEPLERRELLSVATPTPGGTIDSTFGKQGSFSYVLGQGGYTVEATAYQSGGRLLIAGYHTRVGVHQAHPFILRLNRDGTLDKTFAGTALLNDNSDFTAIVGLSVLPDDQIVATATARSGLPTVYRLTASGKFAKDFVKNRSNLSFPIIAVESDGSFLTVQGESDSESIQLTRYTSAGELDTSFGTSGRLIVDLSHTGLTAYMGVEAITADLISIDPQGRLYIAGTLDALPNEQSEFAFQHPVVIRLTTSSQLDTTFNSTGVVELDKAQDSGNFEAAPLNLSIAADGTAYLNVVNDATNEFELHHFAESGSDTLVATHATNNIFSESIFPEPDGHVLWDLGGALIRYTAADMLDTTFGTSGILTGVTVDHVAVSSDTSFSDAHLTSKKDLRGVSTFTLTVTRRFASQAPAAFLNITPLTTKPVGSFVFSVEYHDPDGVDRSTLNTNNLHVVLNYGTEARVVFYKASASRDGTTVTAFYKIAPIGGFWSSADNGRYPIDLRPGTVTDTFGNSISGVALLGTLDIQLP